MNDQQKLDQAVRRTVAFAALRRMRRMIDAEAVHEARTSHWARRLGWLFAALAVGFVLLLMRLAMH